MLGYMVAMKPTKVHSLPARTLKLLFESAIQPPDVVSRLAVVRVSPGVGLGDELNRREDVANPPSSSN